MRKASMPWTSSRMRDPAVTGSPVRRLYPGTPGPQAGPQRRRIGDKQSVDTEKLFPGAPKLGVAGTWVFPGPGCPGDTRAPCIPGSLVHPEILTISPCEAHLLRRRPAPKRHG